MKKAVSKQLEDVLAIVLFDIYVSSSCKIHAKDFIFRAVSESNFFCTRKSEINILNLKLNVFNPALRQLV